MANEVLIKAATAIVWANSGDYSPTVSGLARTHQLDLTSLASTEARQGAKADLEYKATGYLPHSWLVLAALEYATAPADGNIANIYWAGSPHATAGNANPGGTTGADADYSGTAGSTLPESLQQLQWIGAFKCTNDATTVVQYQTIGVLSTLLRYGMPVIDNTPTDDALHSDAVEMYIALIPQVEEIQ